MVVGADHTRTGLRASYSQMGVDVFAAGKPIIPAPNNETMPFTEWFDNEEMGPFDAEGDVLWYKEFVFSGAECSDKAIKGESCVDGAQNMALDGATIIVCTRAYCTAEAGVGPDANEMFATKFFWFEDRTTQTRIE